MWGWGNQPDVLCAEHPVMNRVMFTPLNSLHSFAGILTDDVEYFKRRMTHQWFRLYPNDHIRSPKKLTSSNFEHTFMGEVVDANYK